MSFVDPIGDMITRIRNAQMRLLGNVKIPASKFRAKILDVLKIEVYISDYKIINDSSGLISVASFEDPGFTLIEGAFLRKKIIKNFFSLIHF